jgi:hypothetical protein
LRLATTGPEATKALTALALEADIEANPHTTDGLIEAIGKGARPKG